jgi:putative nucleotidyltransferase with HDIG domain
MIEDQFLPFLKTVLTPKRLEHSLVVMQVMGELAEVYGLDVEKAQTIGILHDAGKDLPSKVQGQLITEGNI